MLQVAACGPIVSAYALLCVQEMLLPDPVVTQSA